MTWIIQIHPKEDYQLEVILDNGSSLTLNLKPKLNTLRFGLLRDAEFFRRAETDGSMIRWGGKVEISVTEVMDMIRK